VIKGSTAKRILIVFFILASFFLGAFLYLVEIDWVDLSGIGHYSAARPSIVLDEEGRELCRFELDHREPITYDKLPPILIKAFVAAEDRSFFDHSGISLKGILRSALVNILSFKKVQGASTITQQVARLMFLSCERKWLRKIQEMFLAFQLERQLSKEQILELYLNHMYFGRGTYGVEAASRRFWNKSIQDVTADEAATLAAVAKSAKLFSPLNSPLTAKKRRDVILRCMLNQGFLTQAEFDKAISSRLLAFDYITGNPIRLYVQEFVRSWAEGIWGKDALYHNGLRIKTTINLKIQDSAEKVFGMTIWQLRKTFGNSMNGGMLSLDPSTGKIRCMIGGVDFRSSQFNRATQAVRQLGSSFKPILYSLAIKNGLEMDVVAVDEPIELSLPNGQVWTPKNWNNSFEGPMTLVRALTSSNNMIAVKLLLRLGADNVVSWAKNFGCNRELQPYPSLALGTAEGTVLENAAAFNVFANNGVYVKPYFIEWVKDSWGTKIWEHEDRSTSYRVLDPRTASKMVKALSWRIKLDQQVLQSGWPADLEAIGKTGTTNGAATTWFVGATPELTTAVYVGRDDNKPMGANFYASTTSFPIWLHLNRSIKFHKKRFYVDPSLRDVQINWLTGEPEEVKGANTVTILK